MFYRESIRPRARFRYCKSVIITNTERNTTISTVRTYSVSLSGIATRRKYSTSKKVQNLCYESL